MYYGLLSLAAKVPSAGYDSDAQAFFTATGITDTTQKSAVNQLVLDLKSYSIWTKMKALYPFVGGTSTTHSYNLINTAQYQITWYGGVTHDSNGITGNGTNGYGNTGLNPSTELTNYESAGIYVRTNVAENKYDMGTIVIGSRGTWINSRTTGNQIDTIIMDGTNQYASSITDSRGLTIANRTSTTAKQIYKNTTQYSATNLQGGYSTYNYHILACSFNNTPTGYTTRNLALAYIGNSLSSTDVSNLYTAVQAFQTTLSRNV